MLQVFFPEGSLEFEIRVSKDPTLDSEPSKRSRSTNFEDSRRTLLKHAAMRIETQRKHQLLLRESTKNNEEIGKEIVLELGQVAQQMEIDKVSEGRADIRQPGLKTMWKSTNAMCQIFDATYTFEFVSYEMLS